MMLWYYENCAACLMEGSSCVVGSDGGDLGRGLWVVDGLCGSIGMAGVRGGIGLRECCGCIVEGASCSEGCDVYGSSMEGSLGGCRGDEAIGMEGARVGYGLNVC